MITTKITIKKHLAEYCIGKWTENFEEPVQFPDNTDLYIAIYDLLQKRPSNFHKEVGNIEIKLPNRREDSNGVRKNLSSYNFLSEKSCEIIDKKISLMFWAELHDELKRMKHDADQNYDITAHFFLCKYRIESITIDALLKNYQRWRENFRKREVRKYKKKKNVKV